MTTIGKILVVDDEVELKNILVEALTLQGYETSGFTSGVEALEVLRKEPFDILLTDLMMPTMDGITLVREALQIDPNLVSVMMTGQGTIQTAVDAMKGGTFDYVLKPFRIQTMLPVVTRAMNTRHLRLENVQLREAVAIHELSETIAFTLDPKTVLSKLADAALQQSEADEVSVLLPVRDTQEFYVAAVRGEKRERLLGERVPFGKSISSWVARKHEPVIVNGAVNDDRFVALWPRPEIRSSVSIPMLVARKLVGVLNLNVIDRPRPFTLGQMKGLTILAGTAAAALESAALYTQVQEAEKNYRSIFENSVEGIFQTTIDGRFLTANPAMARILGYESPEELIETITDAALQIYVDPTARAEAARSQTEFGVLQGFEFEALRKNGEKIWVSLNRRSVRDVKGVELYREGTIEEITDRKLAEAAMRESEERYRMLFDSSPQPMWVYDVDTFAFLAVNEAAIQHYGYSKEEFLAMSIEDIRPEEDIPALLDNVGHLSEGLSDSGSWRHRTKDGSIIEVEITSHLLMFDGQRAELVLAHDVTDRNRAEKEQVRLHAELRQQTERVAKIVATVPGLVFEAWGQPGESKADFVSEYVEQMLGYTISEWLSTPRFWLSAVHPDDRDRVESEAAALFYDIQDGAIEFRWIAKDGRIVWVSAHTMTIRDEEGNPLGIRGVVTDISKRVEAEQALRETVRSKEETLALLDTLLSSAPIGFAFYTPDLLYRRINKWLANINGLSVEEHLGKTVREVLPEMSRHIEPLLQQVVDTGEAILDLEITGEPQANSNREHHWLLSLYPVRMQAGELLGVGVLVSDITERKQAEAALRDSEERYRDLVENAHDIIYSHDLNGNYTSMNEAGRVITGYTREEALELNLLQTVAPAYMATARSMLSRKLAGERVTAYEMEIVAKDGSRVAVEVNTKLVTQNGIAVGVQGIARDITERKRLELALRESEQQLRQSQKLEAIGQLAGGVAHDFNNLLTAINGYSALALRRLGTEHPISSYLEEIKKAGDRAANLTRQLLAFGRKQLLQPLALNVNDIVTDMMKLLKRLIGEDIQLITRPAANLKQIKADPGQLEQVLVNLVVNARDAMPTGGMLTIETANTTLDGAYASTHLGITVGEYVMLAISDTGTGMDQETQSRIFEPFFTTKEKDKGTGLGLSTVYGIVRQSGGNIWVYSEVGKGTTFKVYLPLIEEDATKQSEAITHQIKRGSETVMLVEDEDMVRKLASELLLDAGYVVLQANGGEEAIQLCRQHSEPIDLLITDVVMPKMSGKQVAEQLLALHPETKVLFMSGYTDEAIVHHGVVDSNIAFIQKPFSERALAQKIRDVLDSENGHH